MLVHWSLGHACDQLCDICWCTDRWDMHMMSIGISFTANASGRGKHIMPCCTLHALCMSSCTKVVHTMAALPQQKTLAHWNEVAEGMSTTCRLALLHHTGISRTRSRCRLQSCAAGLELYGGLCERGDCLGVLLCLALCLDVLLSYC